MQAPTTRRAGSVDRLIALATEDMAAVDALVLARMDSPVALIPALAEHLISAGGKRLRPLLTVAAARLCGDGRDSALKLAAAVEFIHTATLLHDDVVDASALRRGKVAAHLIWGGASSVLVGDFLFARAFELMVETDSMRALNILATASRVIAEGEVLQLTRSHDLALDQDTYLQIISAKTAELFAAAAEAGAVAANATPDRVADCAPSASTWVSPSSWWTTPSTTAGRPTPWARTPAMTSARARPPCRCCWPSPAPARGRPPSGSG